MPVILTMDEERDIWTRSPLGVTAPPIDDLLNIERRGADKEDHSVAYVLNPAAMTLSATGLVVARHYRYFTTLTRFNKAFVGGSE